MQLVILVQLDQQELLGRRVILVPLVQLVPLTDKAVKVTNHLISYGEWGEMMRTLEGQPLRFYRKMKLLKRNDKREINRGRCPFSFTYVNKDDSDHNEIQ